MKTTIITAVLVVVAWASTAGASQTALKLENQYRDIAETLSVEFNKGGACGAFEIYTSDIVESAQKARNYFDSNWELNEQTNRKFTLSPETLKAMKSTLALKDIMSMLDRNDPKTFEHALNRVIMWGPAPGAYGNMSYIEFGENNKVVSAELELLNEEPWYQWNKRETTFSVVKSGHDLIVRVGHEEYVLKKQYDQYVQGVWVLTPIDRKDGNPWMSGFIDTPSECEA